MLYFGTDAADDEMPPGCLQVIMQLEQGHHGGGVEMPRVFHAQDDHLQVALVGHVAHLFLEKIRGAEEQLALHVDD